MKKNEAFPSESYQKRSQRAAHYHQHAIVVSKEFRDAIKGEIRELSIGKRTEFNWKLLQHILFSTYTDTFEDEWGTIDEKRIVIPHPLVASMANRSPYGGSFRSGAWLRCFSENVFELDCDYEDWSKDEGRARVMRPRIDPSIVKWANTELRTIGKNRVFFHSGQKANDSNLRHENRLRFEAIQRLNEAKLQDHPAKELLNHLNTQSQEVNAGILKRNWPLVIQRAEQLANSGELTKTKIEWLFRTLRNIAGFWNIYYLCVEGSPRIYASDITVNSLPSELRKIAYTGEVEVDLKACQLAIVASKWELTNVRAALERNLTQDHRNKEVAPKQDIWEEMLKSIGKDKEKERYKPILKDTIYSIIFGMKPTNVLRQLTEGSYHYVKRRNPLTKRMVKTLTKKKSEGMGAELAKRLMEQPHLQELLMARNQQLKKLKDDGCLLDAFGQSREVIKGKFPAPSVLAYVAQSYELLLMLEAFKFVKPNAQIYILSFLHDGMTLSFGNSSKSVREVSQLKKCMSNIANKESIPTELEVTQLILSI